ncbi:hypothetical protein ACTPOK_40320 [Streptomyces inhibens]|uniref:hypothetical protein n=1 Tax=Streptomyces inhibens TaxID=2293571 RepID=UPI00402AC72A
MFGLVAPGRLLQPVPLGGGQDYRARGGNRQGAHACSTWPQLTDLRICHRGADTFAYIDGELADGEALELMRLGYAGSADIWGFAPYLR